MSPIVQQLLTLLGVLLGAGATYTATTLTERGKWRRSHATRWDERRLAAYSEYANALKRYSQVVSRLAAAHGYPSADQPIDIETGLQKMAEAAADRTVKWEVVLLLGSPKAVAAGRLWHKSIWDLSWMAQGQAISHDEYVRRVQEIGRMRNEFYECARSDLGIESGSLPPGDRWWFPPGGDLPAGGREPLDSSES
ncbi:hypothetical protein [Nocardia brasiliensis]|uniref:hypothetical protein n=1 Tax=Nocardia brasiliensis TaxID=37326 RepID=UPI003409DFF6